MRWPSTLLRRPLSWGLAALLPLIPGATAAAAPSRPAVHVTAHITLPPARPFNAVSFATSADGWVAGDGFIWHTANGGLSWQVQYTGPIDVTSLVAVSATTAYAAGPHDIMATTDGGTLWSHILNTTDDVEASSWPAAGVGYAVLGLGSTTTLQATTDGGLVWRPVASNVSVDSVTFVSPTEGWATAESSTGLTVYRTFDGGRVWHQSFRLPNTATDPVTGAVLRADGIHQAWVLFVGQSGMSQTSYSVYETTDGMTWTPVVAEPTAGAGPAPGQPPLKANGPGSSPGPFALSPEAGTAYLAGECEACGLGTFALTKTTNHGASWSRPSAVAGASGLPGVNDLDFPTAETGYLAVPAARGGVILATHNGGASWRAVWPPSPSPTAGVSFLTTQHGFGLGWPGDPGVVLETWNGGTTWKPVATLPNAATTGLIAPADAGSAIQFTSATTGWALAPDNRLYVTHDGGTRWTPVAGGQMAYAAGINLVAGRGCVGNPYEGGTLSTTNDGASWHRSSASLATCLTRTLPSWALRAVADPSNIVAAQGNRRVAWIQENTNVVTVVSQEGAATTALTIPTSFWLPIQTLAWSNPSTGWLLTQGGTGLYATTDGGHRWRELP